MRLVRSPNIENPDDFYQRLIDSQRELSDEQVQLMNAKLILLFANHVGDMEVIEEALASARPRSADEFSDQK